jgi:glutathione S-transferase
MTDTLSLQITTHVMAPRSKVYAAFVTPEILAKWFAPETRVAVPEQLDVRPGGRYRISMAGEDDKPVAVGEYKEVVEGAKLVFTWGWDGDPSQPTLVTVSFSDKDGGTEVVLTHERFATAETRDHHRMGWQSIMDKLGPLLAA